MKTQENKQIEKCYAIRTKSGFYARQGSTVWYEPYPVGWALYCEKQHAEDAARNAGLASYNVIEFDGGIIVSSF